MTNFPVTVTRLVGRAVAVARLRDLMSAYRAVTLTGPGGIGKSTLAMKVARRVLGEFPGGGWLVELASLADPALVASTVADVLGLRLGSNTIVPESVAHAIGDKTLLLVLDNCEHLIGAVAPLAETLLARCPNMTIVATSREILRIQGEHIYRVPSLDVPPIDHTDAIERAGAVHHQGRGIRFRLLIGKPLFVHDRGDLPPSGRHPLGHRARRGSGSHAWH